MKRYLLILTIALVFMVFAWGTSSDAQTAKPIELKLAHYMSPMHSFHVKGFVPFAKQVEDATKGRVKITIYPAEALGKAKDLYDMAKQGVVDIAHFIPGYSPGRFPLTTVMELPIGVSSGRAGSLTLWELYPKYLKSEYPGVKVLSLYTTDPGQILMVNKPVKLPEDLRGMRLRSPGPQQTAMLKEFGASPLSMSASEVYDALQRGLLDGLLTPTSALKDFRFQEVTKYHTIVNLFTIPCGLVMNMKAWNSLPPDIQKVLEEFAGARLSEVLGRAVDQVAMSSKEETKKGGLQTYEPTSEERRVWANRVKPVNDKWIADMEAKGLPGKRVYEDAIQLSQKYSK